MVTLLTLALFINLLLVLSRLILRVGPAGWTMAVPPAVLAGALGLGIRLFAEHFFPDWSLLQSAVGYFMLLPGLMLVPLLAGIPLGNRPSAATRSIKRNVMMMLLIGIAVFGLQVMIGGYLAEVLRLFYKDLPAYGSLGLEMTAGFFGGHATSGVLGRVLHDMGHSEWTLAQALAITYATYGLVMSIVTGLILIKIFRRSGRVSQTRTHPIEMEQDRISMPLRLKTQGVRLLATGFLIVLASLLGLGFQITCMRLGIAGLSVVPPWIYALLCAWLLWKGLRNTAVGRHVDRDSSHKVTAYCSDIAVIAAITALPYEQVGPMLKPVLIIATAGLIGTMFLVLAVSAKVFHASSWLERALLMYGTGTGVYVSGLVLLRMVDPEQESDAHPDAALAYPMIAMLSLFALPALAGLGEVKGAVAMGTTGGFICLSSLLIMALAARLKISKVSPPHSSV